MRPAVAKKLYSYAPGGRASREFTLVRWRSRCGSRPCRSTGATVARTGRALVRSTRWRPGRSARRRCPARRNGSVARAMHVAGSSRVEQRLARLVGERGERRIAAVPVVGAVVEQHDAVRRCARRWAGLDEQRVEAASAREQERSQHLLAGALGWTSLHAAVVGEVAVGGGIERRRRPAHEVVGCRREADPLAPVHPEPVVDLAPATSRPSRTSVTIAPLFDDAPHVRRAGEGGAVLRPWPQVLRRGDHQRAALAVEAGVGAHERRRRGLHHARVLAAAGPLPRLPPVVRRGTMTGSGSSVERRRRRR